MPLCTRALLPALALAAATLALAQTPATAPLPAEAARLRTTLHAELARQAEAYNAALPALAEDYLLALLRLRARLSAAKDAAAVEAVKKEASRFSLALAAEPDPFEPVPELCKEHLVSLEALRLIQEEYVGQRTVADLSRAEKACALAAQYAAALDRLQSQLARDEQAEAAAAAKKEATRVRVVLQRKDAANRLFEEAGARCRLMPPAPDPAALRDRAAAPPPPTRNLTALSLADLPPATQAFLMRPLEFDKDWPPEVTRWTFEGQGCYSHDFSLFRNAGLPDELGIFTYPKTLRAIVRGTKRAGTVNFDNKALTWLGKAASWRLNDSRDLICMVRFRTKRPALKEDSGPAGCVAVYSINENNRLLASLSVPLLEETTQVRMAKHTSYNRLNIVWEGSKRKRGFTIPDHMPLRVTVGVAAFGAGEEVDATLEILPCGALGDMW